MNESQTFKEKRNVSEVMTQISNTEADLLTTSLDIQFEISFCWSDFGMFGFILFIFFSHNVLVLRLQLNPGCSLAVSWALLTWWGGKTARLAVSVSLLTRRLLFGFVGQYVSVCVFVSDSVALKTWIKPWIAAGRKDKKRGQMEVNRFTLQGKVRALLWHRN